MTRNELRSLPSAQVGRVQLGVLALLCATAWIGRLAAEEAAAAAGPGRLRLSLIVELEAGAVLKAAELSFSEFPDGRRYAISYFGVKEPRAIRFYNQLGFRTTILVHPDLSQESIRELEQAGAEIGLDGVWGNKYPGRYHSYKGNYPQECYDASATSRLALLKKCRGPVAGGNLGSANCGSGMMHERRFGKYKEWAYAYHDSNYLTNFGNSDGFPVLLGRLRDPDAVQVFQHYTENKQSTFKKGLPNEKVMYQTFQHLFMGLLRRKESGKVVLFQFSDYADKDLERLKGFVKEYGQHQELWHATLGEIAANRYLQTKAAVESVEPLGNGRHRVTVALDDDLFPPFLQAPLSIQFPEGVTVKSAAVQGVEATLTVQGSRAHASFPLRSATLGCRMELAAPPTFAVPGEAEVTLRLTNGLAAALEDARLFWVGGVDLSISCGAEEPFALAPQATREIKAKVRMGPKARFGLAPVNAVLRARVRGEPCTFLEGFELVVAPRLRLKVDPCEIVPLRKGESQIFQVHLAGPDARWAKDPPEVLVHHATRAAAGQVRLLGGEGLVVEPVEQSFELAADGLTTLLFTIRNEAWGDGMAWVRPEVRLHGAQDPLVLPQTPTPILRDPKLLDRQPLDEKGLLFYASFDDENGRAAADRAAGDGRIATTAGSGNVFSHEGVKGWCMSASKALHYHTLGNISEKEGTLAFWIRRDPRKRNEMQIRAKREETWKVHHRSGYADGESIFYVEGGHRMPGSMADFWIQRWPGWDGKPGWFDIVFQEMGMGMEPMEAISHRLRLEHDPESLWTWRHLAVSWSASTGHLAAYWDGKLAAEHTSERPWRTIPFATGTHHFKPGTMAFGSDDHGKTSLTMRDEVCIYNRALSAEEILDLIQRSKGAQK